MTIVKNPGEPIYKTPILELKEDLSLGGPRAVGDYSFGEIRNFVVDQQGSIYVLDRKNYRVQAFDSQGKYLRTIGRKGQGPGDLDSPLALAINRFSNELVVLQGIRRLSLFRTEGPFVRQLSINNSIRVQLDSRGQIYLIEQARSNEGIWSFDVKKLSMFGTVLGTVASVPGQGYSGKINPFLPLNHIQVDRSDNLVYGDSRNYEILFFEPSEAKLFKKIVRPYSAVPVTEEDRKRQWADTPSEVQANYVFPRYHPVFSGLFLSDLDHIFVRTNEKTEDGQRVIHDIFDAEGRFISRMPLKPSGITILNGKYYALEEDDDGYQYVKRYAVTWKVK
ncbi:MAG: 6-bladed beta-propeller [Candidatus Aminicenantales bacterium]